MNEANATPGKKVILAAVDYSEPAGLALASAAEFVRADPGAELHIVHVVTPAYRTSHEEVRTGNLPGEIQATGRDPKRELPEFYREILGETGPNVVGHVRFGRAEREIVLLARELGADLIVMGTHGKTKLARIFLGSVAERVLRAAPCAVLIMRTKEQPDQSRIEPSSDSRHAAPITFRFTDRQHEAR